MNKKVILFAFLMATFTCFATLWWAYPTYTYPQIVNEDWSFLLGSQTHATNKTLPMTVMLQITKTNAQAGMQPLNSNLTLWATHNPSEYQTALGYTPQQQSANLDAWSLLATSAKQNHSVYLDDWVGLGITGIDGGTLQVSGGILTVIGGGGGGGSGTLSGFGSITAGHIATWKDSLTLQDGGATSQFQTHSGNLDLWSSFTTTGYTNGLYGLWQPLNANLTSWGAFTPTGYTNNLYSLFQPALGFTPLTFQQTSNLILTLTIPLDLLATNGQVSIFGIDSNTNPVPIHLRNNLSLTANGVGGYDMDATGSGGSASFSSTNVYVTNTSLFKLDLANWNLFRVFLETNATLAFTNQNSLNQKAYVYYQQDTNGQRAVTLAAMGGLVQTNANMQPTTNASAFDVLEVLPGFFTTNVLAYWPQNFQPRVGFTNSLATGGGGGGGGTFPTGADVDWRFNGNLNDSSGNGNTASLTNGVANYTADEHSGANGALLFGTNNGNAGWVQAASSSIANYTGDFSASIWVRFDRDFALSPMLFSKGTFYGGGYYFNVHYANTGDFHAGHAQLGLNKASAGGNNQTVTTGDREISPDNTWMNIIVVRNGSTVTTYLNGTALTMSGNPTTITLETSTFLLRVGEYSFADDNPSTSSPLIGAVAQFTIWGRALNSTERGNIVSGGSL